MPRDHALARLTPMRIAVLVAVGMATLRFVGCAPLALLEARAVDLRLRARGVEAPAPEVVIVAVDNASLDELGRWPWPRPRLAELLDAIDEAGPRVIGFDIVQSEATAGPDLGALAGRLAPDVRAQVETALGAGAADDVLAAAVRRSGKAVLGYFFDFSREARATAPDLPLASYGAVQTTARAPGEGGEAMVPEAKAAVSNLPSLSAAARSTGYFNTLPDPGDGYFRRVPLAVRYGDRMALPLSLSMLAVAFPDRAPRLRVAPFGVEEVRLGATSIPVAEDGQMLLNFRGPGETFPHVRAIDVLAARRDTAAREAMHARLRDRIVLVGVTATAVADVRATSFDGVFPGVELHATAIDNILRQDFLSEPRWTVLVEIAAIAAGVLALGAALGRARGVAAAGLAAGLVVAWVAASQGLFVARGIPLGLVHPLLAITVAYMAISVHHFVVVEGEKRRTREAFSRYLNPELARLVSENPELLRLGGTRRCLTVLFSDIRGFTSISEKLEPEVLVEILNVYLGEMTDIVFRHDGTLDKYIGDAIMAVWGAPVATEEHAARACEAALDMVATLEARRDEWMERGWPRIEAGIGLHTGDMVAGNMGSDAHLSYTVMGDNVNLGSRLEGLTKTYGVSLLVSEATLAASPGRFVARELDLVAVKGKALPVRIYELLGRTADAPRWQDLVDAFARGLAAYRERRFEEGAAVFGSILASRPGDGPASLYAERCRRFAAEPPPSDWKGVTKMDTK